MKYTILFFVVCIAQLTIAQKQTIAFTENKGQVTDQNYKARPDVLFGGQVSGMAFHLRKTGISYQLIESSKNSKAKEIAKKNLRYRIDIDWVGANASAKIIKQQPTGGYNNYYDEPYPNGITHVKTFGKIIYDQLYKNIDLQFYGEENGLKYDFILAPGADHHLIQLNIKGATKINLQKDGTIIIKTPLGEIQEGAPIAFQDGKQIDIKWKLHNSVLSFDVGDYNHSKQLIIDPAVRLWGTLYGTVGYESINSCSSDTLGNIYVAGTANLSSSQSGTIIATVGSFQDTALNTGSAFLVKFDPNGVRLWGTFYGGATSSGGSSCSADSLCNIYLCGGTGSGTFAATPGAHQTTFGGGNSDAYLAKFDPSGVRLWGTYYGGASVDASSHCAVDKSGSVLICGTTSSSLSPLIIANSGSHQPNFGGGTCDGFLVKFNSNGVRQWGTYYGDSNIDFVYSCCSDTAGNIFISGATYSQFGGISTPNGHQPGYHIGPNSFLVKFNKNGVRKWGTYYGGVGMYGSTTCSVDKAGNSILAGWSSGPTTTLVATLNSYQQNNFNSNAYLAKFDTAGVRQWGTYFGGTSTLNSETVGKSVMDAQGNIYLAGTTPSTNNIGTPYVHQSNYGGGGSDAFLVKFDGLGSRQWATYYGGPNDDNGNACTLDKWGNIYMVGSTTHSLIDNVFATPGCHQPVPGINSNSDPDGFIAKFNNCANYPIFFNTTSNWNCPNQTTTITANSAFPNFLWSDNSTNNSIVVSPSVTTSYTVSSNSAFPNCVYGAVFTLSVTNFSAPSGYTICVGKTSTLTASGVTNYTWSTSANTSSIVVSPSVTTVYTVSGSNGGGCVVAKTVTVNVVPNPTISVTSYSTCLAGVKTLTASGASSYSWNTGSSLNTATVSAFNNSSTVLTVTGTAANGCKNVQTGTVTVYPYPLISLASSLYSICAGGTYTQTAFITASGVNTYTWSTSANTNVIAVSPTVTTVYSVTGSFTNTGCASTTPATISILVTQVPTVSISGGTICNGQCWNLNPTGAASYLMPGPIFCPSVTTLCNCLGVTNNCPSENTATVYVTVLQTPTLALSASSNTICAGQTVTLNVSGANTYTWSNSIIGQSITVSPTTSITYSVVGSDLNSCRDSSYQNIIINVPVLNILSSNTVLCIGQSATLTASGANTYSWSSNVQGNQIVVSPSITTTYTAYGTSIFGCDTSSSITLSVNPCLGIQEKNSNETLFEIYPNPNNGSFFFIVSEELFGSEIYIYNNLGQEIKSQKITTGKSLINIENVAKGVYHCQIISQNKFTLVSKLIIE